MKIIFFRTKGNQIQGWGNVLRQISLAKNLKKKFKVFFFVQSDRKLKDYLKKLPLKFEFLPNNLNLVAEKKILNNFPKPDYTIIEMLYPKLELQRFYKKISKDKIIVYDDVLNEKYISDYLISCQKIKKKVEKLNKKCKFFNDLAFYPSSEEILKFSKKNKNIKKKIKTISILLGGSYYGEIYFKILRILTKNSFENINIVVSKTNFNALNKKIKLISKKIKVFRNINSPGKFLYNSDLAIVGGGYTKIEAAIVNTPFISISMHKHQDRLIKNFNRRLKLPKIFIKNEKINSDLEKNISYFKEYKNRKLFIQKLKNFAPEGSVKLIKLLN